MNGFRDSGSFISCQCLRNQAQSASEIFKAMVFKTIFIKHAILEIIFRDVFYFLKIPLKRWEEAVAYQ